MNPTERIRWLDAAKGIAIFGVVWLHASPPVEIARYRSFVLPMFFFISGFLFNETKYKNTVDFIKDKAVKILVPYLFFAA
ncbi:MAG: acyltransferase family protein, partial [bacterium]|nr:acyltransferase family protein [bacterium]